MAVASATSSRLSSSSASKRAGCTADGSAGATEDGGAEATTGAMQEAGDAEAGTGDDGGAGGDGCGMDPSEIELTLEVNGQTRAFELHVPADYDPSQAYPLIFGLHGGGGTAAAFRGYAGLDQAVGSEAIVVYPEGLFEEGTTALMHAAAGGHAQVVSRLLAAPSPANTRAVDADNLSALVLAAEERHLEVLDLLLEGARADDWETAFHAWAPRPPVRGWALIQKRRGFIVASYGGGPPAVSCSRSACQAPGTYCEWVSGAGWTLSSLGEKTRSTNGASRPRRVACAMTP